MIARLALALAIFAGASWIAPAAPVEPQQFVVDVIARYPHDTQAWTQGLVWNGSTLYESTGLVGHSSLRECVLATGAVLRSAEVAAPVFAEGLAQTGTHLVQLTWQNRLAIIYDITSFGVTGTRGYDGEGWGLCSDGSHLIMSNGSSVLQFRNPESFAVDSSIEVTIRGVPQDMLNELEYVEGFVYSNVWLENRILKIDPESGETVAEIDASGLLTPEEAQAADVLNGIAYRPETQHFLITGKLWPWIFEVDFVPVPQPQGVLFGAPREAERAVSLAAAAGAR